MAAEAAERGPGETKSTGRAAEQEGYITAYRSVGAKCSQAMDAFERCRRQHKRAPYMCAQLESAVTWCALGATCPAEARALQECADANSRKGRGNPLNPPRACQPRADELERCVDLSSETQLAVAEREEKQQAQRTQQ